MNRFFFRVVIVGSLAFIHFTSKSQILIGPVAGGSVNWTSFANKDNRELYRLTPFYGFHGGVSLSMKMQKRIHLQTNVMYSQRGKLLDGKIDELLRNKATYHYIDVPIIFTKEFKVRFGKSRYYNWYLGAGPSINYWLGGKGTLTNSDLSENLINPPDYEINYKVRFRQRPEDVTLGGMNVENPNRVQLGLVFSGGAVFEPSNGQRYMLTVRYELGHSYFSPDSSGDFGLPGVLFYQDDLQVRNKSLALSLYYFIDLKLEDRNRGKSTIKLDKVRKR